MTGRDEYFLGYRRAEQERLQQQAEQLADEASWLLDQIGLPSGARALEIGCGPRGCLDLLAARVGPTGTVVGVERSEEAVALAREFVAASGIRNVEVLHGDARSASLAKASFDLVTARLVLINVPAPEEIVSEAAALARPGGRLRSTRPTGRRSSVIRRIRRGRPSSSCSWRIQRGTGWISSSAGRCRVSFAMPASWTCV